MKEYYILIKRGLFNGKELYYYHIDDSGAIFTTSDELALQEKIEQLIQKYPANTIEAIEKYNYTVNVEETIPV